MSFSFLHLIMAQHPTSFTDLVLWNVWKPLDKRKLLGNLKITNKCPPHYFRGTSVCGAHTRTLPQERFVCRVQTHEYLYQGENSTASATQRVLFLQDVKSHNILLYIHRTLRQDFVDDRVVLSVLASGYSVASAP